MRLSKYLALCGLGSRRKNKDLILQGRISVNDQIVRDLSFQVDPERDKVCIDGKEIRTPPKVYYLFYKPRGYLTSLSDPHHRETIEVFLKKLPYRVFPVGRLDKESEGLLLLTNDGDLTHFLLHPRFEISRTYHVWVRPMLSEEKIQNLLKFGFALEGKKIKPIKFKFLKFDKATPVYEVIVKEGVKREVRKMVSYLGGEVLKLVRVSFGPLKVGNLKPGEIRPLKEEEVNKLRRLFQNKNSETLGRISSELSM